MKNKNKAVKEGEKKKKKVVNKGRKKEEEGGNLRGQSWLVGAESKVTYAD